MNGIMAFVAASIVAEGILSYTKTIISKNKKVHWEMIAGIALGVLIALNLKLDFFDLFGISERFAIIGQILTGILISRGSNYVYEIYDKLTDWKKEKALNDTRN